jgi:ferritin-like metal-binding protein YciE
MADKQTLKDLLEDEIKDLYSAEKQLTKAIPKMAKGAHERALSTASTNQLKETEEQVARLEEVAMILGIKAAGKKCEGMKPSKKPVRAESHQKNSLRPEGRRERL